MKKWILKNKQDLINVGVIFVVLITLITIAVTTQKGVAPYNSTAFTILGASVAWYAIFILTGIISAAALGIAEFKRKGLNVDDLYDGLLIFVPLAIIGARLFYVLFDGSGPKTFLEIIGFSNGTFQLAGLAIHGAIIIVAVGLILFAKFKKISYWTIVDILAPGFLIGQIMGRWGNFMNQEAFGPAIQSQWVIDLLPNFIVKQMETSPGVFQHPTFLYESMLNLVLFIVLIVIRRKRILKEGDMIGLYFIWYGLVRGIAIEPFRQDPLIIFNTIRVNQWLSSPLLILAGLLIIIVKNKVKPDMPYYFELDVELLEKEVVNNDL